MDAPYWQGKHYAFFQNTACEYFPCHPQPGAERFNCLFCYCPLYTLGRSCGGSFAYLENGIKDCSGCALPHRPESYGKITERFGDIVRTMTEREGHL